MSQGLHAQQRQLAQKRAELRNYNIAKQQGKINDRNQALSILNSQIAGTQQNVGVMQRQYNLQQQQQQQQKLQQRDQAAALLNQQALQQQQQQQQIPMNYGNQMQQQGYNPGMMNMGMMPNQMGMMPNQMAMMQPMAYNPMMQQQMGMMPNQHVGMQQYPNGSNPQFPQASQQTQSQPQQEANKYQEPAWSTPAQYPYRLRLVENGTVSFVDLTLKKYLVVGRQETCDIQLETASVSRQHAVIQHRGGASAQGSDEIFIYDLGSTSGTYLNSQELTARAYYGLQPGDVINFGSSPDFVLCGGPSNYQPPLPVTQVPLPVATPGMSESLKQQKLDDEMDSIIHARCSDHLVSSLQTLEKLYTSGTILDEEYYKKKALIQDQMQKQQEEHRQLIKKKKAEARMKQDLEDAASIQRAKQDQLKKQGVQQKVTNIVDTPKDAQSTTVPSAGPVVSKQIDKSAEQAFSSTLSSQSLQKSNASKFGTIKMDPRSSDFDAVAYKRMMVDQYEQQKRDNEIRLRLKKLGDPTSSEFNPGEYKRLMVEKYEHERIMTETKRLLLQAKGE